MRARAAGCRSEHEFNRQEWIDTAYPGIPKRQHEACACAVASRCRYGSSVRAWLDAAVHCATRKPFRMRAHAAGCGCARCTPLPVPLWVQGCWQLMASCSLVMIAEAAHAHMPCGCGCGCVCGCVRTRTCHGTRLAHVFESSLLAHYAHGHGNAIPARMCVLYSSAEPCTCVRCTCCCVLLFARRACARAASRVGGSAPCTLTPQPAARELASGQ